MRHWNRQLLFAALLGLSSCLSVLAHGDDEHGHGSGHLDPTPPPPADDGPTEYMASYMTYGAHQGWLFLHILTMVIAWVGIMPIGMSDSALERARRSESLLTQVSGHVLHRWFTTPPPRATPLPHRQRRRNRFLDHLQQSHTRSLSWKLTPQTRMGFGLDPRSPGGSGSIELDHLRVDAIAI